MDSLWNYIEFTTRIHFTIQYLKNMESKCTKTIINRMIKKLKIQKTSRDCSATKSKGTRNKILG